MAKKKTQNPVKVAVMLVLIAVVWGAVFYQIFFKKSAVSIDNIPRNVATKNTDTDVVKEAYVLKMDYREPFLNEWNRKRNTASNTSVKKEKNKTPKPQTEKIEVTETFNVKYHGLVRGDSEMTAYIEYQNSTYIMRLGDSLDNYALKRITKDSIMMESKRKSYWVKNQTLSLN